MGLTRSKKILELDSYQKHPDMVFFSQYYENSTEIYSCFFMRRFDWDDMSQPGSVTITVEPGDTLNDESEYIMASKKTHPAVKNTRKVHLERPEVGKRGQTMCGAKAPVTHVKGNKKEGISCLTCSKTLTGSGTWYTATKRKRTLAEKKQKA